ncbi:uncharacterized protein LOC106164373 [Lingula anatina]|uniref:Uncharacterized protein LOC106164373 n=1 Tax=Lingula anatina TaxID=7574 RepID=A0A1S3IHM9_LINAN|nr:uncharacterized protein LOC106164373 [Lingula anatina]|eukprot:XP_013397722.1 uncharacterized protein LOC106164373 [Lingula anatina]
MCPSKKLKDEQKEALVHLLNGEDVFGVLPKGYGKSLIYEIVPKLFPICRQKKVGTSDIEIAASVIVVSPLISLMKDQIEEMIQLGLDSVYLSSEHELTEPELQKLKLGEYDVVLASPESWLGKYRYLFDIEDFRNNICLLVADEAHVIRNHSGG